MEKWVIAHIFLKLLTQRFQKVTQNEIDSFKPSMLQHDQDQV